MKKARSLKEWWKMRKKHAIYATVFSLILLTAGGCARVLPVRDFCVLYAPVYTAEADTEITRAQADANNALWLELCATSRRSARDGP